MLYKSLNSLLGLYYLCRWRQFDDLMGFDHFGIGEIPVDMGLEFRPAVVNAGNKDKSRQE